MAAGTATMTATQSSSAPNSQPSSPQANGKPLSIVVGDRIAVGPNRLLGTVRFAGTTEFAAGEWLGVELDQKAGKNDGSVKGTSYFTCQPEYGLFVRPTSVAKVEDAKRVSERTTSPPVSPAARVATANGKAPSIKVEDKNKTTPARSEERSAGTPTVRHSASSANGRSGRTSEGEQILELSKVQAQMELAQAMEDHDVDKISRVLPIATNLGVDNKEIDGARKIMDFEVQRTLRSEIDGVRCSIVDLTKTVVSAEAKTEAAIRNKAAIQSNVSDWISRMGEQLEKRVLQSLEKKIDVIVEGAVEKASKQLLARVEAEASKNAAETAARRSRSSEKQQAARFSVTNLVRSGTSRAIEMEQADNEKAAKADASREKQTAARFSVTNLISGAAEVEAEKEKAAIKENRADAKAAARGSLNMLIAGAGGLMDPNEAASKRAEMTEDEASIRVQAAVRGQQSRKMHQQREKAIIILQRGARRWKLRKQEAGGLNVFGSIVLAARKRHQDWSAKFDLCAGEAGRLNEMTFGKALSCIHERVQPSQATALWDGFQQATGNNEMDLATFCGICEAIAESDHRAAEFADLPVEEYVYLGEQERAATKIQARQRGLATRQRQGL